MDALGIQLVFSHCKKCKKAGNTTASALRVQLNVPYSIAITSTKSNHFHPSSVGVEFTVYKIARFTPDHHPPYNSGT